MEQIIYSGDGSIRELARIIDGQFKRIFLVTGRDSYGNSGAARAMEDLFKGLSRVEWIRFSEFAVNPSLEDARRGVDAFRKFDPDLVLAIGGGSVLDMAKLIKTLAPHGDEGFETLVKTAAVDRPCLPMVAVPTTAGSGSEATHFAVAYVEKQKFSLAHGSLLPRWVILDSDFLRGASPRQMACSGMDAISQAVESFWNKSATSESRKFAIRAMEAILPAIEAAVAGSDKKAHQAMLQGAHLAGRAINMTKTTAPHALSYTLTTHHGIPHGHAVALILGKFFEINWELANVPERASLAELHGLLGGENAKDCRRIWYGLMEKIGLATDMESLGLTAPESVGAIVDKVNVERLANHPVPLTREDLARVFQG